MNYSIWKKKASFTPLKIYDVNVNAVKLVRRYENKNYEFVASDVELTAYDAEELRTDLLKGEEIYFTIQDNADQYLFRGIFEAKGSKWNAETEEYTFVCIHISKKIFDALRTETSTIPFAAEMDAPASTMKSEIDLLVNGRFTDKYSTRSYIFDLCKALQLTATVENNYVVSGHHGDMIINKIKLLDRREIIARAPKTGFDDFVAEYSFEDKKADYDYVLIPIAVSFTSLSYINSQGYNEEWQGPAKYAVAYILYNGKTASITIFNHFQSGLEDNFFIVSLGFTGTNIQCKVVGTDYNFEVPDRTLDLRMDAAKDLNALYSIEFQKVMNVFYQSQYSTNASRVAKFLLPQKECLADYSEVNILYNKMIEIDLLEKISFQGVNISVREIEDDCEWEDRKIKGRIYKEAT